MTQQTIKDKNGIILGTIAVKFDGIHELRNHSGTIKGTYNPKTNETRDTSGRILAKGNILAGLLQ